jgi:hypothetical protein
MEQHALQCELRTEAFADVVDFLEKAYSASVAPLVCLSHRFQAMPDEVLKPLEFLEDLIRCFLASAG